MFAAAASLLLVTSFLPLWAKTDYGDLEELSLGIEPAQSFSAWSWNSALLKLGLALTILGILLVAFRMISTVKLSLPIGPLYLGIGALVTLLMIAAAVRSDSFELADVEVSRGPLLYLGIVLSLGMAAGGFLVFKQEPVESPPKPGSPDAAPYGTSF